MLHHLLRTDYQNQPLLPRVPVLPVLAALAAGIASAWTWAASFEAAAWGVGATVCALAAACTLLPRWRHLTAACTTALTLLAAALAGGLLCHLQVQGLRQTWPGEAAVWRVQVERIGARTDSTLRADVSVLSSQGRQKRVRLYLSGTAVTHVHEGSLLLCRTTLHAPAPPANPGGVDYGRVLTVQGLSGSGSARADSWHLLSEAGEGAEWSARLAQWRQRLAQTYARHVDPQVLPLLQAITLGDRSLLDTATRRLFAHTGSSHVLALSGLHLGLIYGIVAFVLLRGRRRSVVQTVLHAAVVGGLWVFVCMAGHPLSLVRAALMLTLAQVLRWAGRSQWSLNHVALAALLMLLWSPLSLFDVGFQLSFAAVAGIIVGHDEVWMRFRFYQRADLPPTPPRSRFAHLGAWRKAALHHLLLRTAHALRLWVVRLGCTSLSAQVATLPWVVSTFHLVALYALPASLVVVPVTACLLATAMLYLLVPVAQPALGHVLQWEHDALVGTLHAMSRWPGAALHLYPSTAALTGGVVLGIALWVWLTRHRQRARWVALAALVAVVGGEAWRLRPARVERQCLLYSVPRGVALHYVVSARRHYLWCLGSAQVESGALKQVAEGFWRASAMGEPRMLPCEQGDAYVRQGRGIWLLGGCSVVLLGADGRPAGATQGVRQVDVLVVDSASRRADVDAWLRARPHHVVATNRLQARRTDELLTRCRSMGLPCHSLRRDGAFVLPLAQDARLLAKER